MLADLFPSQSLISTPNTYEKELLVQYQDSTCLLCITKIPLTDRIIAVRDYYKGKAGVTSLNEGNSLKVYSNMFLFKQLSEKYDLAALENKNGKSLIDYLNILVQEDETFIMFATVPDLINDFDWNQSIRGKSPVDILKEMQETEIAIQLIERDLLKDVNYNSLLHDLVKEKKYELIQELREKGLVDLNTQDEEGMTVLHRYLLQEYNLWLEDKINIDPVFLQDPSNTPLKYFEGVNRSIKDKKIAMSGGY